MVSLSKGRTAAAQCGLFIYKSVPVIFEPPCTILPTVLQFSKLSLSFIFSDLSLLCTAHIFGVCQIMSNVKMSLCQNVTIRSVEIN